MRLVAEALDLELAGPIDLLLAGFDEVAEYADEIPKSLEQGTEPDIDDRIGFGGSGLLA